MREHRDGKLLSHQALGNHCDGILPSIHPGIDHDGRIAVIIQPTGDYGGTFAVTHAWHQK
ncbi:MAG: hypothetical protein J1E06_01260 [Acutalibacter sp.]|nr:hypothetical protein [Acutalibacter sp.]